MLYERIYFAKIKTKNRKKNLKWSIFTRRAMNWYYSEMRQQLTITNDLILLIFIYFFTSIDGEWFFDRFRNERSRTARYRICRRENNKQISFRQSINNRSNWERRRWRRATKREQASVTCTRSSRGNQPNPKYIIDNIHQTWFVTTIIGACLRARIQVEQSHRVDDLCCCVMD